MVIFARIHICSNVSNLLEVKTVASRRDNRKWTIQRNCQHKSHKTTKNKAKLQHNSYIKKLYKDPLPLPQKKNKKEEKKKKNLCNIWGWITLQIKSLVNIPCILLINEWNSSSFVKKLFDFDNYNCYRLRTIKISTTTKKNKKNWISNQNMIQCSGS
jgi:hypothetical protein